MEKFRSNVLFKTHEFYSLLTSFIFYTRVLFTFETQKKKSVYNEIVFSIPQEWKNLGQGFH